MSVAYFYCTILKFLKLNISSSPDDITDRKPFMSDCSKRILSITIQGGKEYDSRRSTPDV